MNVPIRKCKAELSRYIRAAKAGKEVVVTSRGRAVARIVPVAEEQPEKPLTREELRAKIKALMPGVRVGTGKFTLGSFRPVKLKPGAKTMSETVIEDRR
jgi:prevent-host-death family protein